MSPNGFKIRKSLPIISEFSERERKRERERERERERVCVKLIHDLFYEKLLPIF